MGRNMFKTPSSPQEKAFGKSHSRISDLIDSGGFGSERAQSQFEQVQPYFGQAREHLQGLEGILSEALGVQMTSLADMIGDSSASHGVARGHDRAGAFIGQMAPAIGAHQEQLAGIQQALAGLSMQEGSVLMDLLQRGDQGLLQALQLLLMSAGGMKSSTALGDWLGILQTGANIGGSAAKAASGIQAGG